jgi:AAA family ATP:ADP antiporter
MTASNCFNKTLKFLFPIERGEFKKFIPMGLLMFCVLFNYSILRSLKDSLVIPSVGAEAVSFLKLYCVLPAAIIFMVVYAELVNTLKLEKVYHIITSFFIAYFVLFAIFLYPNHEALHPNAENIQRLATEYPYVKWFILIYGQWTFASLYILSELWGSTMVSLLFWQFANQITKTDEAKRFYPTFGLIGNFALILSGQMIMAFANKGTANVEDTGDQSLAMVRMTMISVIIASALFMYIYHWMQRNVLTDPRFYTPKEPKKKKSKPSLTDSFKTIFTSKYLGLIAVLVICYGISINLVEGPWKAKVRELYPTKNEYAMFMGSFNQWTGAICIFMFFISGAILRRFSWKLSALITPLMIFVTGAIFYMFVVYPDITSKYIVAFSSVNALTVAVIVGAIQNVLSKATKYTLFDPTKEMAYIPIDDELKTKGKAAVDVVGGRLGKSGGAIIQSSMFIVFPAASFATVAPYLMFIFLGITTLWIFAVLALNKLYVKATTQDK